MIGSLAWKEYREHRAVWVAMAVVGVLALVGLDQYGQSDTRDAAGSRMTVYWSALILAWAYGVVCGAMLLAGEREDGTLTFLDALPRLRRHLWATKCLTGLGLVLGQAAVLTVAAVGLHVAESGEEWAVELAGLVLAGLVGLGWGLLFSADGSNVLQVIGQAIGGQIVVGLSLLLAGLAIGSLMNAGPPVGLLLLTVGTLATTVLTFVGSRRTFSRPDRQRAFTTLSQETARAQGMGWRVLLWLSWQQARGFALGMLLFSLAAGLLVLTNGLGLWPALTLLAGVLCGVTVFADEQAQGAFRFLGDQRFPLGRVWLVKTALRAAIAAASAAVILLPSFIRAVAVDPQAHEFEAQPRLLTLLFHDDLLGALAGPASFLALWVLHGFGLGQLCGLLFRKSLVAGVLGFGASAVTAMVWLPSLAGGGLHLWQVAGVPLLALAASRLLLPAWMAGRLASREMAIHLGAIAAVSVLWVAGALAYRVLEVADVADPLDMPAFVAELSAPTQGDAGQLLRNACDGVASRLQQLGERRLAPPPVPGDKVTPEALPALTLAREVLNNGWPHAHPALDLWIKNAFDAPWPGLLTQAAELPPGMIENPRRLTRATMLRWLESADNAGLLLAVHGLWGQQDGKPAAFVADLRSGLALSRGLRHHASALSANVGRRVEDSLLTAQDRWLERLEGRPGLLRQALTLLQQHEAGIPADVRDALRVECLIVHNTLERPEEWVTRWDEHAPPGIRAARAAAVGLAWRLPWEHARQERLIRCLFAGADTLPRQNCTPLTADVPPKRQERARVASLTKLRAAQLKVALRLYQAEKGKPAATLDDLTPDYLAVVPNDPSTGQPFGYKVSVGEKIENPGGNPPLRPVPAGQGILWSLAPDRQDAGVRAEGPRSGDAVFLVPTAPKPSGERHP